MLIAFLLFIGLCFGWSTYPLVQSIAAKVLGRWLGLGFFTALMLIPALAFAQTPPSVAPAQPNVVVSLLLQYLPYAILLALGYFVSHQSGIIGWIQSKRDAADASALQKGLCAGALVLDHMASDFATKVAADLKANPSAKASDLAAMAAKEAKATLSEDGAQALQDGLGIAAGGLEARISAAIQSKLAGNQTHAAAVAGAAAAAQVQGSSLAQVSAALAKGPQA